MSSGATLYTVGHSTHSIGVFISLLKQHEVTEVADVRSAPYSRMQSQFNKEPLAEALQQAGITYVFLGKELGARSADKSCYVNGRVQYSLLARTESFKRGLERAIEESKTKRVALMCAEKEPLECHRTLLVAKELDAKGAEVKHIHADGRLESHYDALVRLLKKWRMPEHDLFRSTKELFEDAMAKQEERVAYVDETLAVEKE